MSAIHQVTLYVSLVFLGLSLLIPGLMDTFRVATGSNWLIAADVDAKNHLRGLSGIMAAVGAIALWACWDLPTARSLVQALGMVMVFVVAARASSMAVDGIPSLAGKLSGSKWGLGPFFWAGRRRT